MGRVGFRILLMNGEWAFPRAPMEVMPTLQPKDPCLTLCWTFGAWFGSSGSRSALGDLGHGSESPSFLVFLTSDPPLPCPSCLGDPDGLSRDREWTGVYPQPPRVQKKACVGRREKDF